MNTPSVTNFYNPSCEQNSKNLLKKSTEETDVRRFSCKTTDISSGINSGAQTLPCKIEYDNDESLDIKQEFIQDQETRAGQKRNKQYKSKLTTTGIRVGEILVFNKLPPQKKRKISESRQKPEKEYKCEKCARSYSLKNSLYIHKKFECDVPPQFTCTFCSKRFKHRSIMNNHINRVHLKKNARIFERKYNCENCALSYCSLVSLKRHQVSKHAEVKPQFTCDICGHKAIEKGALKKHITRRHVDGMHHQTKSQPSNVRHYCDQCSRNYSTLNSLKRHKNIEHSTVKPQFICDYCGYKANQKSHLKEHIISRHLKDEVISKIKLNISTKQEDGPYACETTHVYSDNNSGAQTLSCKIEYENDESLDIKEELIEDQESVTDHEPDKKHESNLSTTGIREGDISIDKNLLNQKEQSVPDPSHNPETKYKCEKCARSYKRKESLNSHQKFDCDVTPQFKCKFCSKQFKRKSIMNCHIVSVHEKTKLMTSQTKFNCETCCRSYSTISNLNRHKRSEHAGLKRKFTCDICGYETNEKCKLSTHINLRHQGYMIQETNFKPSKRRYYCDQCSRSYSFSVSLYRHKTSEHAAVKPQFVCDECGHKTKRKSYLKKHINIRHLK
ncbi:zinc finger protein 93-like [Belonocnema kinseyi]|uniref:zinc finger protein 93-like n=1 Tax=Belonocnema kinseyi TaxID=2817044 RepID=UPI00143CC461|nr:zinc finger protein 93-like [Belonocnema kinseyi]